MKLILKLLLIFISLQPAYYSYGQSYQGKINNPVIRISTELGDIDCEIFEKQAPVTASNFLKYIESGLFNGASFYRVVHMQNQEGNKVKIEVIQGGMGFSGSSSGLAPIPHERTSETGILHQDGTLSMARDEPGTATSEFFICINKQPELDYGGNRNPDGEGFAAFGRVINGMDVVRKIQALPEKNQFLLEEVEIISIKRIQ